MGDEIADLLKLGDGITPGPWQTEDGIIFTAKGSFAEVWNAEFGDRHSEANARAIAAVPRMLTALAAQQAEIERLKRERDAWRAAAQKMTPGGSEFSDPKSVSDFIDVRRREHHETKCNLVREQRRADRAEAAAASARADAIRECAAIAYKTAPPDAIWERPWTEYECGVDSQQKAARDAILAILALLAPPVTAAADKGE